MVNRKGWPVIGAGKLLRRLLREDPLAQQAAESKADAGKTREYLDFKVQTYEIKNTVQA